jgi:hypothetical protein
MCKGCIFDISINHKTNKMQKRQDYRNHIKQLSLEGLIKHIEYYTDYVIKNCDYVDVTRQFKMLTYAKERLNKLTN